MRKDYDLSFETRVRVRNAYREFLNSIDVNYFITFNFGYRIKTEAAHKSIVKFCNMIQRVAFGNNWNEMPPKDRITLAAFGEHMQTNPHWHAPAEIPATVLKVFERFGEKCWLKIQPRGEFWAEVPDNVTDVVGYCTKRLLEADAAERVCLYFPQRKS